MSNLVSALLSGVAAARLKLGFQRAVHTAVTAGIGIVFVLAGAGFAIAGAWIKIAEHHGAVTANAAIAAGLFVIGGIILLASSRRSATPVALSPPPSATMATTPALTGREALPAVALVTAVGLALGRVLAAGR